MNFDWSGCPAVWVDPERLGGTPAFRGTRVPISALFTNLRSGASLDDFISWFPGITRKQVEDVLAYVAKESSALVPG
jgi:uncharacterized protein (DUF433 family)